MNALPQFQSLLSPLELIQFESLETPTQIQAFLDRTPYSAEESNRSPLRVMRDGIAHCLDGGLFAAVALRRLGYPPLVMDIFPEPGTDDDHVLAVYKVHGCFGALAKSNYACLRSREPVYRSLRELVMSYFDWFYNIYAQKTLRSYTRLLNLATFDRYHWMWEDSGVDRIEKHLLAMGRTQLLSPEFIPLLVPVDPLTFAAGRMGVNPTGLYQPGKKKDLQGE
jgi:hypothetical protein